MTAHYLWRMQLISDQASAAEYLLTKSLLQYGEIVVDASPAGEGNMNVTLKITTDRRAFILKQSRPFVAKFPSIPAPVGRIAVEKEYLAKTAGEQTIAKHHPAVLHYDAENYVLVMEYLQAAHDLSYLYGKDAKSPSELGQQLGEYLSALHRVPVGDFPANHDLRALNHAHIFDLPFRADNGFPLEDMVPGLGEVAKPYQHDEALRTAAARLGEVYLADGPTLVHGDFYPGSFMERNGNLLVIDGEFAHPGRAEFDLGVLLAHLEMAGLESDAILGNYQRGNEFDEELMHRFRAVEVMRRLIGIAQLPVSLSLEERRNLLAKASDVLLS